METDRPPWGIPPPAENVRPAPEAPALPASHDVFVAPTPQRASVVLWAMVAEEMAARHLTLAAVSRGSGVRRQTLARYRDQGSHYLRDDLLDRLGAFFDWGTADSIRARISARFDDPVPRPDPGTAGPDR